MLHYASFLVLVFFSSQLIAAAQLPSIGTRLSVKEETELSERIERFYAGEKESIDHHVPKYDPRTGLRIDPNASLRSPALTSDPLLRSAGRKTSPQFQKMRNREMIKHRFPYASHSEKKLWETFRPHDRFEDLVRTWVEDSKLAKTLDAVPARGEIEKSVWSGDYWRTRWGQTSYRYSSGKSFSSYKEAVADYAQPVDWGKVQALTSEDEKTSTIATWSPSEKYDLLVGSEVFALTDQQKMEGSQSLGEDGDVENWFGICHGWAPASFMVPVPAQTFSTLGLHKASITWYPDDVKAMATLAWANGRYASNFMGGRCDAKDVERYENGRLSQAECFDNNPASFHLALGNMLGNQASPIVMDATFDYQVWNQPVLSYEYKYFNPLSPKKKGSDWRKFAVDYDEKFKKKDRFQEPLTRGERSSEGKYDDSKISQIVGVAATVVYLMETAASTDTDTEPATARVTYTYDLELVESGDTLLPIGGEWHENAHPDFLWVPQKESVAMMAHDREKLSVDFSKEPEALTRVVADHASGYGYPLCQVLAPLVEGASGDKSYRCKP